MDRKPQDYQATRRIRHLEVYSFLPSHPLSVQELAYTPPSSSALKLMID